MRSAGSTARAARTISSAIESMRPIFHSVQAASWCSRIQAAAARVSAAGTGRVRPALAANAATQWRQKQALGMSSCSAAISTFSQNTKWRMKSSDTPWGRRRRTRSAISATRRARYSGREGQTNSTHSWRAGWPSAVTA